MIEQSFLKVFIYNKQIFHIIFVSLKKVYILKSKKYRYKLFHTIENKYNKNGKSSYIYNFLKKK
jgi:hypothetical protein